jgi:hypothetical protein
MIQTRFFRREFIMRLLNTRFWCVAAAGLIAGTAQAASATKAPLAHGPVAAPAVQVEGQIFVVTNGHESVKLALVSLSLLSEDEVEWANRMFLEGVENRRREISAKLVEAGHELHELNRYRNALKEEQRVAADKSIECALTIPTTSPRYETDLAACNSRPEIQAAQEKARQLHAQIYGGGLEQRIMGLQKQATGLISEYDATSTQTIPLYAYLDRAVHMTKTDADGKFKLSYDQGRQQVLLASSSRLVGASTESYQWLVRLPQQPSSARVELMLANDNLDGSHCGTCLRHEVVLAPSPEVEAIRQEVRALKL